MGLNLYVFIYQLQLGPGLEKFFDQFALVPEKLWQAKGVHWQDYFFPYRTLITSIFLHGGWLHLLGNMLTLWVFGGMVEDRLGHCGYFLFYIFCGVVSGLGHALYLSDSTTPCVGASGAIAGLLGASLLLYPKAKVLTAVPIFVFIKLIYLPAFLFFLFWFSGQLLLMYSPYFAGHNIAVMAHIVGFTFGLATVIFFKKYPPGKRKR